MAAAKKKAAKKKKKKKTAKKAAAKKAAPKKAAKKKKAEEDGFAAFTAQAKKAWPDTIIVASEGVQEIPCFSTGNIGLDIATFGGWRRGRIHRIYGLEKAGKTGTMLNSVLAWQKHCALCYKRGPCEHGEESGVDRPKAPALYIDAEHRLADMWKRVADHGIDLDRILVQQPPTGQHVVDFVDSAIREKGANIGLVVVDSVAHITSKEEIDKATMKGRTMAVNAQLINRAVRKWTAAVCALGISSEKKPTILLVNQLRQSPDQFKPEVQTGGKGLDYATSLDLRLSAGKYHYVVPTKDGKGWEDKVPKFSKSGQGWKPDPDAAPDYVEINYRVTNSGVCPNGRYGSFQYWLRPTHGRRIGDPDNMGRLWEYSRKYFMEKVGWSYSILGIEASTQNALKNQFVNDPDAVEKAWSTLVSVLSELS